MLLSAQVACDAPTPLVPARALIVALTLCTVAPSAMGQALQWDANGVAPVGGGAGTWDVASLRWYDGTTYRAWNNAALSDATFGGTAGAVTLSTSITVHNISFTVTGYSLTGSTLTFGGVDPTVAVTTGTATIASIVDGAAGLIKSGTGTLVMTGTNIYSGTTTISGGTLQVGNNGTTGTLGSGAVVNNGTLTFSRTNALTIANAISGSGNVIKASTGTTTFTGNNTYAGTTTISGGTLQIGDGGTTGTLGTGSITNTAILAINRSDTLTLANAISGTGGQLRQIGAGTTILTGANTYTGATTISAGTLQLGNGGATGSVTSAITNNATLAINRNNALTMANVISGTGVLRHDGIGTTTLSGTNTFTGAVELNGGVVQVSNLQNGGVSSNIGASSNAASNLSFDGGTLRLTGTTARSTNRNFIIEDGGATIEGIGTGAGLLTWTGTASYDVANQARSLTLGGTANGDHFAGALIDNGTGALSLTKSGTGRWILSGNNSYSGTTTISAGTLQVGNNGTTGTLGGGAVINNGALAFARSDALSVINDISGTGSLTKSGTNTVTLTGTNTYSGTTTISGGTLQIGNGGATGTLGSGAVTNSGILSINRSNVYTIGQVVSGTGQLQQVGTGTTILTNANTYTGATTISAGTLQIGNGGTTGSVASAITNNATLAINRSNALTMANVISGTGVLRHDGIGTTTLSGTNTFTGAVELNGGILLVSNLQNGGVSSNIGASSNAASNLSFDGGTLRYTGAARTTDRNFRIEDGGATLDASGTGALTWSGTASYDTANEARSLTLTGSLAGNVFSGVLGNNGTGSLSVTKSGAGSWILTGNNSYSGTTTISAGTLQVGNGGTTGSLGSGAVVNNGVLTFSRSDAATVANAISGSGNVIKAGAGTATLTGANTYGGTTTISAGTLQIGAGGTTGSLGTGNVAATGILAINRSDAYTIGQVVSGAGQLQQIGAGTTILTGANTYTGATTISAGTLQIGNGGTTGSITSAITNNATLAINRNNALTMANVISGTGVLRHDGIGTTTLSGTNTFTGAVELNGGVVQVSNLQNGGVSSNLGASSNAASNLSFDGGTLRLTGTTARSTNRNFIIEDGGATIEGIGTGAGLLTWTGTASYDIANQARSLTLGGTASGDHFSGVLVDNGTGALSLTKSGTGRWILSGNNSYSGTTTISAGTLQVGNNGTTGTLGSGAVINNGMLTLARSDALTVANGIGGTGSVTKSGTNTLTLTGTNTYSGTTTISGGTLQVGNGGTVGTLGTGNIASTGTLAINRSDAFTIGQSISGTGGQLRQMGAGTTTLTGTNTYTGTTTISAGTLQVGNGGTTGTLGTGSITNTAILAINRSDALTIGGVISGTGGQLRQIGAGTTILTGANTYTGATTISAGTLQLGNGGATGSVTSAITNNATFAINRNNALTMANVISGTGVLRHDGIGTTTLSGTNTFTGAVELNGGVLLVSNLQNGGVSSNIGASSNAASNLSFDGGTLRFTGTTARSTNRNFIIEDGGATIEGIGTGAGLLTWTGTASYDIANQARSLTLGGTANGDHFAGALIDNGTGALSLTKSGTGRWILSGNNSYSGSTTISAGTLQVGNNGTTGTLGSGAVINNGALTFARSDALSVINDISGTGSLTKAGTNAVTLTGTNTYTGTTTISGGTLQVGNGGATGTLGSGVVTNDGVLVFNRSGSLVVAGTIAGTGSLLQSGTGTTQLNSSVTASTTNIAAGTLRVDGSLTTPTITLAGILDVRGTAGASAGAASALTGSAAANSVMIGSGGVLRATGDLGAGSDVLDIAGVLNTGAGTLNLGADDDALILRDGASIVGGVSGGAGSNTLTADMGSSFSIGGLDSFRSLGKEGAGTLTLTGPIAGLSSVSVNAGALNSTASLSGITGLTVANGAGLVANGAIGGTAGADAWNVAGTISGPGALDLGAGDDELTLADGAMLSSVISGGAQADTLTLNNTGALALAGASVAGFERLVKSAGGSAELGGSHIYSAGTTIDAGTLAVIGSLDTPTIALADDSALSVSGSVAPTSISGSAGINVVSVAAGGNLQATGGLGDGADTLDVAGTLDTGAGMFDLGDGDDTFVVHDGTSIIGRVSGGAGNNTFATNLAGVADLGSTTGFASLVKAGSGTLNINGPGVSDFSAVTVDAGTLRVAGAMSAVSNTTVRAGSTLHVDGAFAGTSAADIFDVLGTVSGAGTIDLGDGDDVLTLRDGATVAASLSGGSQAIADTVSLNIASLFSLEGSSASGFERLVKEGAGTAILSGAHSFSAGAELDAGTLGVAGMLSVPTLAMADDTTLRVDNVATIGALTGSSGSNSIAIAAGAVLNASGDLGDGADSLDVAGILDTGAGAFSLGAGDDTLTIRDGTILRGNVAGGSGNNTLNTDITASASVGSLSEFQSLVKGGTGTLSVTGPAASAFTSIAVNAGELNVTSGGSLNNVTDLAIANGATLRLAGNYEGTSGDDRMTIAGRFIATGSVDLGNGADRLDVLDTLDLGGGTLTLGSGDDTLTLNDAARILGMVDAGAGNNTLSTDIASSATLGSVAGFQSLVKTGAGTLSMAGPGASAFTSIAVNAGELNVASGSGLHDIADLTVATVATLRLAGSYQGTSGDDRMTIAGHFIATGSVDLGDGADRIDVLDALDLGGGTLALGNGDDTLTLHDGARIDGTVDGGAGNNTLNTNITTAADLGAVTGFASLVKSGAGILRVNGPSTSVFNSVTVATGTLYVAPGAIIDPATTAIASGATLQVDGSYFGTSGDDTMTVSGSLVGTGIVDLGAGNDNLDVSGIIATATLGLGAGNDTLTIRGGTRIDGRIDGGAGMNTLNTNFSTNAQVGSLTGFESLTKTGAGTLSITGAEASAINNVTLREGRIDVGAQAAVTGVRATSIMQGATLNVMGSYLGSDGVDSAQLSGALTGTGVFNLGGGNDLFALRDGAALSATVSGGDSLTAGDTLLVDNVSDMSVDTSRLAGFENLRKRSSGVATVSGSGVFANSIIIDAGTLSGADLSAAQITVATGATLVARGSLTGNVSNAGLLSVGTSTFDMLVIRGNYVGNDGLLDLRVALGDDASPGDRLVIDGGAASGTTRLRVINQDGLGARTTGSGIQVIGTMNGGTTTTDAFRLDAPVLAGAYSYELFHGASADADPQGWYLRSLAPVRDIASLATAVVPVAHDYGLALASTLQDREGTSLKADCDGRTEGGCQWGRVWYRTGERNSSGSPRFDYDTTGFQMGTDVHIDGERNREDRAGVFMNVGTLGADPMRDDGVSAGAIEGRAYSLATYLTHRDAARWYLDSSLFATYFDDLRLEPRNDSRATTTAWSVGASIEGGKRISFGSRFSVEPQLQIIAQHIKQSETEVVGAELAFEDSDTVVGRAGLSFDTTLDRWNLWLRANYWNELDGDARTEISAPGGAATLFASDFADEWMEISAGAAFRLNQRGRMHISVSNSQGLGDSNSNSLQGNLGFQFQW